MKKLFILFSFISVLFANQKVSILLDWKYQFEFAGYIAAKEKGFYKEAGVDVDLVEYNHNDIVKDVLSGKYNFGIYDNHLVDEKIKGKAVKLVASIFKRSALVLVTQPYIKNIKDLEHKKIMISTSSDISTLDFLKENKIDLSTIQFIKPTFSIEPFVKKKIDAMSAFITNETYQLEKKGIKFNVINPSDYNFLMYQGEFFTSKKFADENPVLVDRIKKATIKGWEYALKHKQEIIDIILKKYNTQNKTKDAYEYEAKEIEKIIEPYIYPIGYINKPLLKVQFLYESKKTNKKIDVEKELNEYIFTFENPLNLSEKYLPIIKLYNIYTQNKTIILISLIFILILSVLLYFYIKLNNQKKKIETLFNKAPVAYVLMDIDTRIILNANRYAYELFKYPADKKLHIDALLFHIDEKHYQKFQKIIQNYIDKNKTIEKFNKVWQLKKYTGEIFWADIKAIMFSKNQILWIISDIDEIMKMKEKLDLQNKQIKKAMKVKEEFLANMSHEIRTPLNAILGFVDIIYNREKDKENKKYLEIIKKSGKSLLTIINDILDFSKIESGKLKIEKIEFNPREEFGVIISLFDAKVNEKGVILNVNMNNLDYCIISDPIRIKQVISNLISNAIKFTPAGKKVICNINYNPHTEKLYIEVIDEGIGIKKEKLNSIFNPFSQADTSTTRKYGGTGLGLTISKNLVKLLGGRLKVESEVNKGSKFYFSIPAKKTKKIKETEISKKENNINEKFTAKVLVVEDNKANQMFFKVILNSLGIKDIDIANDGIEGVEKASDSYDIIFMDENMPNMNGIEATKKIKEKGIKTPIIAVTANALSGDKEKFLNVMDDYLPKPVEKEKLVEILRKYLKGNK